MHANAHALSISRLARACARSMRARTVIGAMATQPRMQMTVMIEVGLLRRRILSAMEALGDEFWDERLGDSDSMQRAKAR